MASLTAQQKKALKTGKTTKHFAQQIQPQRPTLRQRAFLADESFSPAGTALYRARTQGIMSGIDEIGQKRAQAKNVIKAIGRENMKKKLAMTGRMSLQNIGGESKSSQVSIPTFLTKRVTDLAGDDISISDLTKTGLGAPSQRKVASFSKSRKKNPQSKGGRKKKSRRRKKSRRKSRRKSHRRR